MVPVGFAVTFEHRVYLEVATDQGGTEARFQNVRHYQRRDGHEAFENSSVWTENLFPGLHETVSSDRYTEDTSSEQARGTGSTLDDKTRGINSTLGGMTVTVARLSTETFLLVVEPPKNTNVPSLVSKQRPIIIVSKWLKLTTIESIFI